MDCLLSLQGILTYTKTWELLFLTVPKALNSFHEDKKKKLMPKFNKPRVFLSLQLANEVYWGMIIANWKLFIFLKQKSDCANLLLKTFELFSTAWE